MYSGPAPWQGIQVRIIRGVHKSKCGTVQDVQCNDYTSISGLNVTVELSLFTPHSVNPCVTVDYEDIREYL